MQVCNDLVNGKHAKLFASLFHFTDFAKSEDRLAYQCSISRPVCYYNEEEISRHLKKKKKKDIGWSKSTATSLQPVKSWENQ